MEVERTTGVPSAQARELIGILNEVGDAVSSGMGLDEILDLILERAKGITDTEKVMFVLTGRRGGDLDLDSLVVRGSRGQHLQGWWETDLPHAAQKAARLGRPFVEAYPAHDALLLCSPILAGERFIGLMCAINSLDRPFVDEQIDFFAVLSAFASSAIENSRLVDEARDALLASERDRIAHEMHDGVIQSLFSISLGLEHCRKHLPGDPDAAGERIGELQTHLDTAMTELRRAIYDLRVMKLAELGLRGAVEYWVREVTSGCAIRGRVEVADGFGQLSPAQEACLYRIAKEAVSNVVRHSSASGFTVRMTRQGECATLEVIDDGVGFDAESVVAGRTGGLGLKSMRDRAVREGGTLQVRSEQGSGTTVIANLPVGGAAL